MNKLLASPHGPRIINVSSNGLRLSPVRFQDWNFDNGNTYNVWRAYGQSKTANNLMALSLAQKLGGKGLIAMSIHPGFIATNLMRFMGEEEFQELSIDEPFLLSSFKFLSLLRTPRSQTNGKDFLY